jgi:hypothetical protein
MLVASPPARRSRGCQVRPPHIRAIGRRAQSPPSAPDSLIKRPRIEFFGQLVSDVIHDFNVVNPDFYDVLRPTQLPAFQDEFGRNNHSWFSVRPTRIGTRLTVPTDAGHIKGIIYAPGTILFFMARREQSKRAFTPAELLLFVVAVIGAVIGVAGLAAGWISI